MIALFKRSIRKRHRSVSIHVKMVSIRFMWNWMVSISQAHPIAFVWAKTLPVNRFTITFYITCRSILLDLLKFPPNHKSSTDASAVKAEGPGLRDAISGQKTHFIISTLDAGSGTKRFVENELNGCNVWKLYVILGNLTVTIDGPAKVSLDCTEIDDGYKAR